MLRRILQNPAPSGLLCCWFFRLRRLRHKAKLVLLLVCVFVLYSGSLMSVMLPGEQQPLAGELSDIWPIDGGAATNVTVFFMSAYLDRRRHVGEGIDTVRVLAYMPNYANFPFLGAKVYCRAHPRRRGQARQRCLKNPAKVTILSSTSKDSPERSYEIMINCALDEREAADISGAPHCVTVSLGGQCNSLVAAASNCAEVVTPPPRPPPATVSAPDTTSGGKTSFGLCLIAQNLHAIVQHRLEHFVEFLEINKILGAAAIHLSMLRPSAEDWWSRVGIDHADKTFELKEYGRLFELCPDCISLLVNDCIYRTMHRHDYVLVTEGLEVLFPRADGLHSWRQLISTLELIHNATITAIGAFSFQSVELFDETSNATSSYSSIGGQQVKYRLPRIVTHRLRERNLTAGSSHSRYLFKADQVLHVTRTNAVKLGPGHSRLSVPVHFGAVHLFSNKKPKYQMDRFVIDSSMDRFVPRLLQALHRHFYR